MLQLNINIFVVPNEDAVNQIDHDASGDFLNVFILLKLSKPALLICQSTFDAVSVTDETRDFTILFFCVAIALQARLILICISADGSVTRISLLMPTPPTDRDTQGTDGLRDDRAASNE